MKRSLHRRRPLGVQELESRKMMAGNVQVGVGAAGEVAITGDNLGNGIEVRTFGNTARVMGLSHAGSATTINGSTSPVYITLTDDMLINMNGGNDRVDLRYLYVNDLAHSDLNVYLGQGADDLLLDHVDVARNLFIDAGTESDDVRLTLVNVGNDLTVRGRHGDDRIDMQAVFADDVYVYGDHNKDEGNLRDVHAVDELFVDLGDGDDQLWLYGNDAGRTKFLGGNGTDHLFYSKGVSKNDFDAARYSHSFEYKKADNT